MKRLLKGGLLAGAVAVGTLGLSACHYETPGQACGATKPSGSIMILASYYTVENGYMTAAKCQARVSFGNHVCWIAYNNDDHSRTAYQRC